MELMFDGMSVYGTNEAITNGTASIKQSPFVWVTTNNSITDTTESVVLNPLTGTNMNYLTGTDVLQGIVTSINTGESWKTLNYLIMFTLDADFNSNMTINLINKVPLSIGVIPRGMIMIWSGTVTNIPNGWALCDGTNGTPDLNDKFIFGTTDATKIGTAGGEKEHTLQPYELPKFSLNTRGVVRSRAGTAGGTMNLTSTAGTDYSIDTETSQVGQGSPHNNMPPYYTLAYIMKL